MTSQRGAIFHYLFQLLSTAAVLYVLYIEYARLCLIELDMIGMVFQTLFAAVVILFTLAVCSLLGLPLRLVPRLARWWRARQYLALLGVGMAAAFFCLAFYPGWTESAQIESEGAVVQTQLPNANLLISGWFLLAFCMLHFYPGLLLERFHSRKR